MIFSENRYPLFADADLRFGIMFKAQRARFRPVPLLSKNFFVSPHLPGRPRKRDRRPPRFSPVGFWGSRGDGRPSDRSSQCSCDLPAARPAISVPVRSASLEPCPGIRARLAAPSSARPAHTAPSGGGGTLGRSLPGQRATLARRRRRRPFPASRRLATRPRREGRGALCGRLQAVGYVWRGCGM